MHIVVIQNIRDARLYLRRQLPTVTVEVTAQPSQPLPVIFEADTIVQRPFGQSHPPQTLRQLSPKS
jgi:hypothetical protein